MTAGVEEALVDLWATADAPALGVALAAADFVAVRDRQTKNAATATRRKMMKIQRVLLMP